MAKKKQQKSTKKASSKNQAKKQTKNQPVSQQLKSPQKNTMTWQSALKLIIVGLLVLGLVGSMSCGIIASAYGLPAQQSAQITHELGSTPKTLYELQASQAAQQELLGVSTQYFEGDRIDGKPEEDYAGVTDDFPLVDSAYAGLCTTDGRILFERNIDEQVPMASTTKMMTALVALETTALDTPLTVTYGAANTGGTDAGLEEGMVIDLLDCLYALLLPSGNDAAVVIAENISGMETRFVDLMNEKAAELGMSSTHYVDASGLSTDDHYTTVRDYLLLARTCMGNETFRQIVATDYYEADVNGVILDFHTTDLLADYVTEAQPLGIKTGYTDDAGYCFVGAADLGGIELYSVVFNAVTGEQRFADTATLLEWGFRHYRTIELINTTQQVADVALLSWIDKTAEAYVPAVVRVEIFDLAGPITQDISIQDVEGEASKGRSCGEIIWSQGGEVLTTSQVVLTETVLAPDFWEGIGIAFDRFWRGFSGDPTHAETSILLKSELAIPASVPLTE